MEIRRNIRLFKLYYLFSDMWPLSVLAIVFFQQISGSYAFALGIFSIASIVQSLVEVPTGVFSDKIGRKKTMVLASVLRTAEFVMFALAGGLNNKFLLVFGAVFRAFADAFVSGTDVALMYETIEELNKSDKYKYDILYARSKTFQQIGMVVGALVATVITYFYSLRILAWITVVVGCLQILISLRFVEPQRRTEKKVNSVKHFLLAIKAFIKNKKLRVIATMQMLNNAIGVPQYRLESAYFNILIPIWAVNVTRIIKQFCGIIGFMITPYFRKLGFYRLLFISKFGIVMIRALAVALNNFVTPFIQSSANILYGSFLTAESTVLQAELSPKQRATMGSVVSSLCGILSAATCWVFGIIADVLSVRYAVVILIVCNVFLVYGYKWMFKKYKQ